MPANKKLTKVIAGRTIAVADPGEGLLLLTLDDDSVLRIETAPSTPNMVAAGGKLLKAREDGASFNLDLEGGSTIMLTLANPGGSVEVRDGSHRVRYEG